MAPTAKTHNSLDSFTIHEYYMAIINSLPNIIYWIDVNGQLKGCNQNFVHWVGLKRLQDFTGTPYEQMSKLTDWPAKRIAAMHLDDVTALFAGEAQYNQDAPSLNSNNTHNITNYSINRVPLLDHNKKVVGLVVSILEQATHTEKTNTKTSSATSVPTPVKHKRKKSSPSILMVEDQVITQTVEKALLTTLHCHVDIAGSGEQALTLFKPGKYDLIFMDIGMNETSGYAITKKIRQMENNTKFHVPIIALTSYNPTVIQDDCHEYNMEGIISKPLTKDQATQIIQCYILHEPTTVVGLRKTV